MELLIDALNIKDAIIWLEHGDVADIARQNNMDRSMARKHLKGIVKRPNVKFINSILDRALQNKRLLVAKQNAIKKIQLIQS